MKRSTVSFARLTRVGVAITVLAMAAGLASLPGDAMANPVYTFDNLASAQIAGDRVNNVGRGMAQAFVVNASSSLASAVFGIYNLNGTTGTLNAALYSVTTPGVKYLT